MDTDIYDCQPLGAERSADGERDYGPLMTPTRRAALDALERELSEFLKSCQR